MAPGASRDPVQKHQHEPSFSSTYTTDGYDAADHPSPLPVPIHPLASMQGPFEESMLDATGGSRAAPFKPPRLAAELRHQAVCKYSDKTLETEWNFTYNCHWRTNPKAKYHTLRKTVAQIAFGVHLLHQHLEKSVSDVADILLKHVHELDAFLQRANEDMESAVKDMLFRCNCLRVPMEHVSEFDRLLEDRQYRAQLLEGNILIERTIQRMSLLMNDYIVDLQTLRDATSELDAYLEDIGDGWMDGNEHVGPIYSAMCGNALGWSQFIQNLLSKAQKLGLVLVRVGSYCNEIEKRCGAASRRSLLASRSSSRNSSSSALSRPFKNFADNKPLPTVPKDQYSNAHLSPPRSTSAAGHYAASERRQSYTTRDPQKVGRSGSTPNLLSSVMREKHAEDVSPLQRSGTNRQASKSTPRLNDRALSPGNDTDCFERVDDDKSVERGRTGRTHHEKRPQSEQSRTIDIVPSGTSTDKNTPAMNGDASPPLTAQDSAYSSVSGSFASPALAPPLASPTLSTQRRVPLGLFPSNTPPTPKFGPGGYNSNRTSAMALPPYVKPVLPESRSQSQLSGRRLLKKPSLSSIKNFFTRKKSSPFGASSTVSINE